jgi:hypothetical protein
MTGRSGRSKCLLDRPLILSNQITICCGLNASHYGYAAFELDARLHLGEVEMRSGKASAGQARLRQLRDDARSKGFLLVASKASLAMNDPSRPKCGDQFNTASHWRLMSTIPTDKTRLRN